MEHPYRVHSSIGFGFLQLLMLSSLAYPSPPPPLYHNIALARMMGTVYFTLFQDKPFYLKLECVTILLEVIRDGLYIWYIIRDYTYVFGVFDIVSNLLFCTVVGLSLSNNDGSWDRINESLEGIRKTCVGCCWTARTAAAPTPHAPHAPPANMYSSLPMHESYPHTAAARKEEEPPIYTFGMHRQAFKPSFYSSSWGREYLNAKVEREFDQIDKNGMIKSADGTTQYIRFDEVPESTAGAGGAHHYANIFVSPYFTKEGSPITTFSEWTKTDSIGVCLFIYNLIQFIYQLMMYRSIVTGCAERETDHAERLLLRWMC
jgi:hypothetical protein